MSKFAISQFNTYHVNWLTYAHDREKGNIGLADYLAQCMGLPEKTRLELFEAPNDTQYACDIKLTEFEKGEIWVQDRQEAWDNAIEHHGFEHWRFHQILLAAVERGFLAEGHYVISVSW